MRRMSASLLVLSSSASLILLTDCLKVGAVVFIGAELVAEVAIYVAEVPPIACMVTLRPAISLDESELERARLLA